MLIYISTCYIYIYIYRYNMFKFYAIILLEISDRYRAVFVDVISTLI